MSSESFDDRVKRLFGSKLFEAVPKSSFPTASWSVAHGEVERREWNRERGQREREDDPCSSAFYDEDGCLLTGRRKSRRDKQREFEGNLGDLDEEEEDRGRGDEDDDEALEREIRGSVGLDPALDNEDEEDEYDKAALGRENADERVYMKDIKNHGPYMNYHAVVPDSLDEPSDDAHSFDKDPRADHFAASLRLKEDKSAAGSSNPASFKNGELFRESPTKMTENDVNPKPILKRKEAQIDEKPKKRVRFDPEYINELDELSDEPEDTPMVPNQSVEGPSHQSEENSKASEDHNSILEESPGIPDYLRNPSKYTHYSFDLSDDGNEETNRRAFQDFRKLVKEPDPEFPVELPKSVAFTPRKKSDSAVPMDDSPVNLKEHDQVAGRATRIAAGEAGEGEACEMDEDNTEPTSADASMGSRRGRQYRLKSMADGSN